MGKRNTKRIADLEWTDSDGDHVRFTTDTDDIGDTGNVAVINLTDGETGSQHAVYIDEMDAGMLIGWLKQALDTRPATAREAS